MVRSTTYIQTENIQKSTLSLIGPAPLGTVSERRPHQPSVVYLIPTSLFNQKFPASGDSSLEQLGIRRKLLAVCK